MAISGGSTVIKQDIKLDKRSLWWFSLYNRKNRSDCFHCSVNAVSGFFGLAEFETNEDEDTIHLSPLDSYLSPQDLGVLCLR